MQNDIERPEEWRGSPEMHPWSIIAEELLARGWSIEDLAIRMADPEYDERIKASALNILTLDLYRYVGPHDARCRIGIGAGQAIARAFGVEDDFILKLESAWLTAQGMGASGQDAQQLEAKPASPVHEPNGEQSNAG